MYYRRLISSPTKNKIKQTQLLLKNFGIFCRVSLFDVHYYRTMVWLPFSENFVDHVFKCHSNFIPNMKTGEYEIVIICGIESLCFQQILQVQLHIEGKLTMINHPPPWPPARESTRIRATTGKQWPEKEQGGSQMAKTVERSWGKGIHERKQVGNTQERDKKWAPRRGDERESSKEWGTMSGTWPMRSGTWPTRSSSKDGTTRAKRMPHQATN